MKRTWSVSALILLTLSIIILPGCPSSGVRAPNLTISDGGFPNIDQAQNVNLTLSKDSTGKGVVPSSWKVASGPGAIAAGATSTTATYDAPLMALTHGVAPVCNPLSDAVTISAVSAADNKTMVTFSLTVNSPPCFNSAPTLPAGMEGAAYGGTGGLQLLAKGGAGTLSWSLSMAPNPAPGLTMSTGTGGGLITGMPLGPAGVQPSFMVTVTDQGNPPVAASRTFDITVNNYAPPAISPMNGATTLLSDGTVGTSYPSATNMISVSQGHKPYTITAPMNPAPGLTATVDNANGMVTITGTPAGPDGTVSKFTVSVTDNSNPPQMASQMYQITEHNPSPPHITTTSPLPDATNTVPYPPLMIMATGGVPGSGYSFTITSGALPNPMVLDLNGTLHGTPNDVAKDYNFTVTVSDHSNPVQTNFKAFVLTLNPAPPLTLSPNMLPDLMEGTPYDQTVTASGGVPPYTFAEMNLPTGITPTVGATTVHLTGTPTGPSGGKANFTIQVTDSATPTATVFPQNYMPNILPPPPIVFSPPTLPNGTQNILYDQTVTVSGGFAPYLLSVTGNVPTGVVPIVGTNTVEFKGTPTATGPFTFTVHVTDQSNPAVPAHQDYTVTINAVAACTPGPTTLCGKFTFLFQGYNAMGAVAMEGSFTTSADGTTILGGMMEINGVGVTSAFGASITPLSSFSFDADQLGTLKLNVSTGAASNLVLTFAFVMRANGTSGSLIMFDASSGIHGSGFLEAPDQNAFNIAAFNGSYALGFTGSNANGGRVGMLGIFSTAGNCMFTSGTNGSMTVNIAGTPHAHLNFTGGCNGTIDPNTGRSMDAIITIANSPFQFSPLNFIFYIIRADKIIFIEVDDPVGHALLSGEARQQKKTMFTNTDFSCGFGGAVHCVLGADGTTDGTSLTGEPSVLLARVTVTSQASATMSFHIDVNDGGTLTLDTEVPGFLYSVQTAGNGTITPPALFASVGTIDFVMTNSDTAFLLTEGAEVLFGELGKQKATALSNVSAKFFGGTLQTVRQLEGNAVGYATLSAGTGAGTFTNGFADLSGNTTLITDGTFSGAYTIDGNGRGTGSSTIPSVTHIVLYVTNTDEFVVIGWDVNGTTVGTGVVLDFRQ